MRLPDLQRILPWNREDSDRSVQWERRMNGRRHVLGEDRRDAFRERGFRSDRPFFPHTLHYVPRAAPDAMQLAGRMCGLEDPAGLWEMVVSATEPVLSEFPSELFHHDELMWHRQQMGLEGHVAYAALAEVGSTLYGLNYVSDLVQRNYLVPEFKTRIHSRFRRWYYIVLNGVLAFARRKGYRRFCTPSADLVLAHTDPEREVGRELFESVYDRCVHNCLQPRRERRWWVVDLPPAGEWPVPPEPRSHEIRNGKTVCILHDVEGGLGHRDTDPELARQADRALQGRLRHVLRLEREAGVTSTYAVVGRLLDELRGVLDSGRHALAFHSYDHRTDTPQLERCREVDYRIGGYRPPRSVLTDELSERGLARHNFEWIASAASTLGCDRPVLERSVVKIPVAFDDYPLYSEGMPYEEWEERALGTVAERDFVAFGLHDCYADHWLPHYRDLLRKLASRAELLGMDEVASRLALGSAV